MKSVLLLLTFFILCSKLAAQNVGIGTAVPAAKLEIKDTIKTRLTISSKSFNDTSQIVLSNRNSSSLGTDIIFSSNRENGLMISSQSDLPLNTNDSILTITPQGRVGINKLIPQEKLDVNGNIAVNGAIKVAGNETTANGQTATIKLQNTASANSWILRTGATGTTAPNGGFSISDNSGYHLNIASGGNIGLGIMPSAAKLHINGETKLQGLSLIEFGAGVAGKEVNAGKIGYNAFGQNALTFVGAGTNATNRAIYFYAEGGIVMNGALDIGGALKINGNAGTSGQVLTSNGLGSPSWTNTAYANSTRFSVNYSLPLNSTSGDVTFAAPVRYNLDPGNITMSTNSITLTKSGLYRFSVYVEAQIDYSGPPVSIPFISAFLKVGSGALKSYTIINNKYFPKTRNNSNVDQNFNIGDLVSFDVYVEAGSNVRLNTQIFDTAAGLFLGSYTLGHFSGYLISE